MRIASKSMVLLLMPVLASAGLVGYGACQAGCAGLVMACYGTAGATWGATAGATVSTASAETIVADPEH